jgi:diguanylate cyclase (GGDEF)-like protein
MRAGIELDDVLDAMPVAVCLENWGENLITCVNQRALNFWGMYLAGKNFGLSFVAERVCPPDRKAYQDLRHKLLDTDCGEQVSSTLRLRDAAGEWRWISCWLTVLSRTSGGLPERVLWSLRDVTEDKRAEAQLRQALYHDALTGLYNRAYFDTEMARLDGGREYPVGIIMMDVDTLKVVNDTRGHAVGDTLLQRLGSALRDAFRHGDVVARIGGDEFAVLLPHSDWRVVQTAVKRIDRLIRRSNRLAAKNAGIAKKAPVLGVSVGAAVAEKGQSLARVLQQADQRMYRHKASRKGIR